MKEHLIRRITHPATLALSLVTALTVLGCSGENGAPTAPGAQARGSLTQTTSPSGSTSTLIGRSTFADPFNIRREAWDPNEHPEPIKGANDWELEIQAKPSLDVATQTITFDPGGQSGWHSHPGPVFISVVEGTMTFYESDDRSCRPTVRTAGQGFLDVGDHAHIARNETSAPARNVVTYFAPRGAALRIDAPNPGNCQSRGF